ncbi:MAG TPA: SGNH/GDSL hydrolase family protein [Hyphomonadaceae bacterium]|jgi:lysophospholipase L1-like esterase|nr:SGNH/GDSL hydrolase family protein [Hyphomonadaceae bacterium]
MIRTGFVASLALLAAACSSLDPPGSTSVGTAWVGSWGASPAVPTPASKSFENQTVRQVLRLSAGGSHIRIRLTNEYGDKPLKVGSATIQRVGADGQPTGDAVQLSFGGAREVVIPKASPFYSESLAFPVKPLELVAISLFLPEQTGPCTCHALGVQNVEISGPGDFTHGGFEKKEQFTSRPFLSAIEVSPTTPTRAIITFGDSITDGYQSTIGANRRWPDVLAERLQKAGMNRAVVNEAISGNRILSYGNASFGDPALARFDRDVLTVPGAQWLVMLEGVNDLGMGAANPPTFETMKAGYEQVIERAHAHGLKVYLSTIIPYEGARYHTPEGEVVRHKINDWIRLGHGFEGFIDLDAAIRDPANPDKMKADLQSGDWLHPNDAGYKVMGEAIDLALFR